jgi:hypothetical protein
MKKILFLSLATVVLYAQQSQVISNFISQGGEITPQLNSLLKTDKYFKEAVDYLENPDKIKKITINNTDIENPKKKTKPIIKEVPDYIKIVEIFKKSVYTYKNPISAYTALYLIKTYFQKSKNLKDYKELSEIVYNTQKNICTSYLDYGEVLENGYFTKVDKKRAYEVYKEGMDVDRCKNGWYLNIFSSKIHYLKKVVNND